MRRSGVVTDARGMRSHDHLCWIYDAAPEFRARAREFLADGLKHGERVCYIGAGFGAGGEQPVADDDIADDDIADDDIADDDIADDIADVPGMAQALRDGAAQALAVGDLFPPGTVVDPAAQARWCARNTEAALADGFGGLRLALDATTLVRTPEQLLAFARSQQLVDRYLVDHPVSALCGYDRGALDGQAVARLACLHPGVNAAAAGFRLYAASRDATCLCGELDMTSAELFPWALRLAEPPLTGDELVFEAADLTFIDHRGLLALGEYARTRGGTAVLRTGWPGAGRIVTLLDVEDVRVEPLI